MKKELMSGLKEVKVNRLSYVVEGINKWRQRRNKKPAIIMAALTGSIKRVK